MTDILGFLLVRTNRNCKHIFV